MVENEIDPGLTLTSEEKKLNPIISKSFAKLSDRQKKILGVLAGIIALSALGFATASTFGLALPVIIAIASCCGAAGGVAGYFSPKTALKSLSVSTLVGAGVGLAFGGPVGLAVGASLGSGFDMAVRMFTKEKWSTNRALYSSLDYISSKLRPTKSKLSTPPEHPTLPAIENEQGAQPIPHSVVEEAKKTAPTIKRHRRSKSSPPKIPDTGRGT